ncbi:cytochrome c oxidase assembly protein [Alsobacter soli]|uniref:Cytochrome c oxidase assembly protein CtaG n=1 Tax=Alsobacter soli TaxID=2109933 RepID=A0A2T1HSM8_9HYPH|nr:cytochrome c oxidase assembly protein [Alsobacter soli]PSC04655.1 cytochrome c oxidase assembly protein [Alsobacter soli]
MTETPRPSPAPDRSRAARRTVIACAATVAGMVGLSYAAVPLYRIFCQATGFGGTPQVATEGSKTTGERVFTVRFDSNVAPGLSWRFEPEQPTVDVKVGETTTIFYKITNTGSQPVSALASFNVAPELTGAYFTKLQCFCFNEITLKAGETLEAPVVFYIDPAITKDRDLATASEITLSYTIFPSKGSSKPVAENNDPTRKPKL